MSYVNRSFSDINSRITFPETVGREFGPARQHKEDPYDSIGSIYRQISITSQKSSTSSTNGSRQVKDDECDDSDKQTYENAFTRIFKRFADKTSMLGVSYIVDSKLLLAKILWILITLAAIIFSILHMYVLIDLYYQYPKQTKLSLGFSPLRMPAITLCNVNPIRRSMLHHVPASIQDLVHRMDPDYLREKRLRTQNGGQTYNEDAYYDFEFNGTYYDDYSWEEYYDEYETSELGPRDVIAEARADFRQIYGSVNNETRAEAGHSLHDMLIRCSIKGRRCNADNFTLSSSLNYGNCYTLESEKFILDKSGPEGGLSMVLYLENFDYIEGFSSGYGVRIAMHEVKTTAFPQEDGFYVSAGTETNIGIRMRDINRLGDPYGKCETGDEFQKRYGVRYTRQTCQYFCSEIKIYEQCKCYRLDQDDILRKMNIRANRKWCSTESEVKCMYKTENLLKAGKLECDCLNPCHELDFPRTISSISWPSYKYAQLLTEIVCDETGEHSDPCTDLDNIRTDRALLRENFLKINIYYESLNFEKIEEAQDYEDIQFLSDVGGAVGLWIGLSVLSVFELGQLILEVMASHSNKLIKALRIGLMIRVDDFTDSAARLSLEVSYSQRNGVRYRLCLRFRYIIFAILWNMKQFPEAYQMSDGDRDDKKEKSEPENAFVRIFCRFASKTSMLGIGYIATAKLTHARVLWILITTTATVFSILHMYILIDLYYKYPKQTKLTLGFSPLKLPAVTVCNVNPIRKSMLDYVPEKIQEIMYAMDPDTLLAKRLEHDTAGDKNSEDYYDESIYNGTDDYEYVDEFDDNYLGPRDIIAAGQRAFRILYGSMDSDTRFTVGHQLNSMMLRCRIKGRKCSADNFTLSATINYGNCYTIQNDKYILEESGPDEGMSMVLHLENLDYIEGFSNGYGARVVIHETGTLPLPHEEGFFVSAGTETNIALEMREINRLGKPFGKCETGEEFGKEYRFKYTRHTCHEFCLGTKIYETCKCHRRDDSDVLSQMNISSNKTWCTTRSEIRCIRETEDSFYDGKMNCECFNPCQQLDFPRSVSEISWPSHKYSKLLLEIVCDETGRHSPTCVDLDAIREDRALLREHFLKINIYYRSLNFEKIEEVQAYEDIQFLSDVGGAIGLWIGLSVLSVFEVGQLLVELFRQIVYRRSCQYRSAPTSHG